MTERAATGNGSGRVLVAGSINTDLVAGVRKAPAAGETVTGHEFAIFGGGKGANQAVAAARSGAITAMLGAVGADDFGRQRLADLQGEGIDVAHVARSATASSGVALIVVEEGGQNRIAYVPGATWTVTPEQAARALNQARPAAVLVTLELPKPALRALFEAARSAGSFILVNATPEAAEGRELATAADVLIVNETEAADLLARPIPADGWNDAALALSRLGPPHVVVTLGAAGAVVADHGAVTRLPAPAVDVVDTTGAGDAFCGATAARIAAGEDVTTAARAGVVAGSLAVTKAGAQPSMPRRDEIERLLADHGRR